MEVHFYMRAKNDAGVEYQRQKLESYYTQHLSPLGYVRGAEYVDGASSGQQTWQQRTGGSRCSIHAVRGDIILVSRLSIAFRLVSDFSQSMKLLKAKGVAVLVAELPLLELGILDGAEVAWRMVQAAALVAELQTEGESDRGRWRLQQRKNQGRHVGYPPRGYMFQGPTGRRRLVEDPLELKWIARILELSSQGMGSYGIYFQLVRESARRRNGKGWSQQSIARVLQRAGRPTKGNRPPDFLSPIATAPVENDP